MSTPTSSTTALTTRETSLEDFRDPPPPMHSHLQWAAERLNAYNGLGARPIRSAAFVSVAAIAGATLGVGLGGIGTFVVLPAFTVAAIWTRSYMALRRREQFVDEAIDEGLTEDQARAFHKNDAAAKWGVLGF